MASFVRLIPQILFSVRTRLLLVSAGLLLIPLIGYRFVMEMRDYLREGQQQVLVSAARLLSATLSDRPLLISAGDKAPTEEEAERRRLVALFSSSDPETAANLGAAYQPSEEVERILAVVAKGASRIWVVDSQSRIRGLSGNLHTLEASQTPKNGFRSAIHFISRPLVKFIFSTEVRQSEQDVANFAERAVMSQVERALNGEPTQLWRYAADMQIVVLSAAQPIWVGDEIVGAVVAEESTGNDRAITAAALESLLASSLVVFLVGFLALAIFAWRLAYRVERLRIDAGRAIDANGRITGTIAGSTSRDEIGELARTLEDVLYRLARYNAYLEQMAARLAHELRTPVAVVRSSLDNLRHAGVSEKERIYVERADDGVRRLSSLIARMSEAAQLEGILQGSEKVIFDLGAVVFSCVEGYRQAYPASQFVFKGSPRPVNISGVPDALAQLLDKLVQNAIDFSKPETPIVISLDSDRKEAILSVENQGPPISAEILSSLFVSMVSDRGKLESHDGHLGLGLYIARLIADFHGATVRASNQGDGSGARFSLRLPLTSVL